VTFGVRRAEIDATGRLVLHLSTADRSCWARPGSRHLLSGAVAAGGVAMRLPKRPISASGEVTLSAQVGLSPVRRLTARAVALSIEPEGVGTTP
jgi:hypothetical protein